MDIYDQYERDADQHLAAYGLRVAAGQVPIVRDVLMRETQREAETYAGTGTVPGNTQLMRICAVQLWHVGAVEDALVVHRARGTSMDATGAIDAELMLGAGVAKTKDYLATVCTEEAREILEVIAWVEESYDPGRYAAFLDRYYRAGSH
ncbi:MULTISPECIES: hypothetical protein [Micromonospora]|uniref:Uncharacterized protein n=1 Tax=Micromonospora sicca TaxID=2202420 RepID=A0A317DQC4_9ACTN|nr:MULTISPECIES: hypothetical protein [unclassified Micromonospora]MBM0229699.1 hypothetical protein [Micromonospora sp. ATA51]PWR16848.1 hypothetical protein DKT69_03415 [Micromonospora sp. 4G51]